MSKRQGSLFRLGPGDSLLEAEFPLVFESDARPVADHPRRIESDPDAGRRLKRRRRAFGLLLGAVFLLGVVATLFGENGLRDHLRLRAEHRQLTADVERRRAATELLRRKVDGLESDPMAKERVAREQLGYARPGELVFLLPRD